jgi:RNA polymerase sigma-70 factor, ECF subfamily
VTTTEVFDRRIAPYRRELLAHCYRMLGSLDDAEDATQETLLRAWRSYATFEGRSSLRVWLYRIATNTCITARAHRRQRFLPSGASGEPDAEVAWLQPIPDAIVVSPSDDPATIVATRQSVRLALVAGLQFLAPRQRAVIILRDVLSFTAPEVAAMLDTSVAAVKSALQRARARLEEIAPDLEHASEPTEPHAQALLRDYMYGFERYDMVALERALRTDAAIELVGSTTWFAGRRACMSFLADVIGAPGNWRMFATVANGQPAAVAYHNDGDGTHRAYGLGVLTVTATGIARITVFGGGADLVASTQILGLGGSPGYHQVP